MSQVLKVAVVGLGIGMTHLKAFGDLPDQFSVRALCDINLAKAKQVAEETQIPTAVAELDELCGRDDIDVIDLCTPPHFHFQQSQQVLAAGKHVICEKPLTGSVREVDLLIEAERQSGKRLMPIFQYRFGHGVQKLKHLISMGLAGKAYLTTVETAWRRRAEYYAEPWRGKWSTEMGGCLLGHAIHAHDILTYVAGPIRSVFARTATRVNPIETEDCASASLLMSDGSLASLSATLGSCDEVTRHRFCFSGFSAESNTRPYTNTRDPWKFTGDSPAISERIEEALSSFIPEPEIYTGQFTRYYRAIKTDSDLPVTLADARAALELITALYYSAETGQAVDLPLTADHPRYSSWIPGQH